MFWGINRIYLAQPALESLKIKLDYYTALDKHLWQQEGVRIAKINAKKYFVPDRYLDVARENIHHWKLESFSYSGSPATFSTELIGHGYTTIVASIQLAVRLGAAKIVFFGVDWSKDTDGTTHFYGTAHRSSNFWTLGKEHFLKCLAWLDSLKIEYTINSDLFN